MRKLTDLQQNTIDQLAFSLASCPSKRIMVQGPTGYGKSLIISRIASGANAKCKRVNVCVPAISLIDQLVESLHKDGLPRVGVIQADHEMTDPGAPIQVCSVQTLMNRKIPPADIVVIDEAHKWFKFYGDWMTNWDNTPFVGLSATPWTKGLGKWYDELQVAATTSQLIDLGYLSPFRVFCPDSPDLSRCAMVADDYQLKDASRVMLPIVGNVVQNWLANGEDRPTLCFAVDRAHAKALLAAFRDEGVPTDYVDAYTPREYRNELGKRFNRGEVRVVVNVGCLTTGVDWDVRCVILARPTKSQMLFCQIIGRGLRLAPGKTECLIFDHTGTHELLGPVTEIHHTKLSKAKKIQSQSLPPEKTPTICPQCKALKAAGVSVCPICAYVPARQTHVVELEAELTELDLKRLNRKTPTVDKFEFYCELLGHARAKRYSPGWAANQYKVKFGVWPNAHKDAIPKPPTAITKNWIKSRNIAWAKSKNRNEVSA